MGRISSSTASPQLSLAVLRRASWLVCGVAGLCLLVWVGWRVNAALAVPPRLTAALQEATQRGHDDIRQHLQQAHQVLDGLMPRAPVDADASALSWVQDPALFAPLGFAVTRITPDIRFVYFDNLQGAAHGVENTADGFRFGGREPRNPSGQVFESRRLGTSASLPPGASTDVSTGNVFNAAATPFWFDSARQTSARVLSSAAWSKSNQQLEVTLSQAIYRDGGELLGVVGSDLSLKRLPQMLSALKVSPGSLAYLVDQDGRLLASTYEESLVNVHAGQLQRRSAADSASAIVRASVNAMGGLDATPGKAQPTVTFTVKHAELTSGNFLAQRQLIDVRSGRPWQLVLLAPERDFLNPLGQPGDWLGVCLAMLTALSLAVAVVVWHVEHYLVRAQVALKQSGFSAVSFVNRDSPIAELQRFSAELHRAFQTQALHHSELDTLDPSSGTPAASRPDTPREAALRLELAAASDLGLTAVRSRAAFLAVISHEFRTPLNGASGMSALLADTPLTPEQRGYLDALTASNQQLQGVLDEIVEYCRTESGDVVLESAAFNVRAVIDQACDETANTALNKGLDFKVDVVGSVRDAAGRLRPWVVQGDAGRVSKVVTTLVLNAIKFTDTGSVQVLARSTVMDDAAQTPALEVQVRDTGPGMSPAQIRHIFKPFTQLDASISRLHGGTGLGLAICKRLANLMGGTIEVDSEPGRGSVFRFILPVRLVHAETTPGLLMPLERPDSDPPAAPDTQAYPLVESDNDTRADTRSDTRADTRSDTRADTRSDTRSEFRESAGPSRPAQRIDITVLVVDDNEINLKVACAILSKFGYTVRTANGGRDAIAQVEQALARQEKIDVVLMDVHMPGVDGIQATQAIVMQHGTDAPPIIALTADVSGLYVQRCLEAGMVDYLTKPLQPWALAQSLLRWVGVGPVAAGPSAVTTPVAPRQSSPLITTAPAPRPLLASVADDDLTMPVGLVDLDRLNDFREFDDSQFTITREVINLLFKEVPVKLVALEQAVANDDVAALISAAHSLRGVSGHVGAVVVQHLCSVLERSAIAESRVPDDAGACLVALRGAWSRTRPLLEDWH